MIVVPYEIASSLGFDLAAEVAAYQQALEAHRFTVNVPRPTHHPVVETIVAHGGEFSIGPEPEVETPNPPEESGVPRSVTMAQARIALLNAGLLDQIEEGINNLPESMKRTVLIAWEKSPHVSRNGNLVMMLADDFGLTEEQLDALFVAAAAIEL
jgi:hypothetical protein